LPGAAQHYIHQQQEAIDPTQEDTIEKEHFTTAGRPANALPVSVAAC
jgi:hypothetical protein